MHVDIGSDSVYRCLHASRPDTVSADGHGATVFQLILGLLEHDLALVKASCGEVQKLH